MAPLTPLLRPSEYFSTDEDPLVSGFGVFVAYVGAELLIIFLTIHLFLQQVDNTPPDFETGMYGLLTRSAAVSLFIYLFAFLLIAIVMHKFSGADETAGTFDDAFRIAGWSYAPNVLSVPILLAIGWHNLMQQRFDGSDPSELVRQVELAHTMGFGELQLTVLVVTVGWSVYILARGVSATHEVPIWKTLGPAIAIGLASLVFTLL